MKTFANLASRAFNTPLLVDPHYAGFALSALAARMGAGEIMLPDGEIVEPGPHAESYQTFRSRFRNDKFEPYGLDRNGIATISIEGSTVHKLGRMEPYSGMMGYDGIRAKIERAADDPQVRGILLDYDSPGGEVSGAFDLQTLVAEVARIKPVAALADERMTSAAMLTASGAGTIYAAPTASVGSIGVLWAHQDFSGAAEQQGVRITLVHSGAHKVDGNPYEALPSGVRADIQGELDALRERFAGVVGEARGRGRQAMLDTEARVYTGAQAVKAGLADHVMEASQVSSHFARRVPAMTRALNSKEGKTMANQIGEEKLIEDARAEGFAAGKKEAEATAAKQAGELAAAAEAQTAKAVADAVAGAKADERERVLSVMSAAYERGPSAVKQAKLLLATDIGTDAAKAIIEQAAPAQADTAYSQAQAAIQDAAGVGGQPSKKVEGNAEYRSSLHAAAKRIGINLEG